MACSTGYTKPSRFSIYEFLIPKELINLKRSTSGRRRPSLPHASGSTERPLNLINPCPALRLVTMEPLPIIRDTPMVEDLETPFFWPIAFKNTFKLIQRIVTGKVENDMTAARSLHALVRKQLAVAAKENFRETQALLYPETGEQANFELMIETVMLRTLVEGAPQDTDAREEMAVLVENWISLPGMQEPTEKFLRYLRPRLWKGTV